MALPSAELLVQRGHAENSSVAHRQQRQVTTEINIRTPLMNDGEIGDAMLDEQALGFRDGEEQRVKVLFIRALERTQLHLRGVLQFDFFGVFLEFHFK